MSNINQIFFNEYTALDNLLKNVYKTEKGVTSYLDIMKNTAESRTVNINHWNYTYKKLRYLRHIRNNMAHEIGAFEAETIKIEDVEFIRQFYNSVINCTDPLSIIFERNRTRKETNYYNKENSGCLTFSIVFIILGLILAAYFCFNYFIHI